MSNDVIILLAVVTFMFGFVIFFFFAIYKVVHAISRRIPMNASVSPLNKAQLDTIVLLTPTEQTTMRRKAWIASILILLLFGAVIVGTSWNYYRFVLTGQKVQATILSITKHRSGGRHQRTTYRYTLQAEVRGAIVTDTYSAGSSSSYNVGDRILVYATTDSSPELAIAKNEEMDPLWVVGSILLLVLINASLARTRKKITTGSMRIRDLSRAMRRRKLQEIQGTVSQASVPATTIPGGLPTYTIGGVNAPKANDGSDYKS